MTELAAQQPISVRQIGRVRAEELLDGYRIVTPREFPWKLFVIAGIFSILFSVLPNRIGFWGAFSFYGGFALLVTMFRLTQRHIIRITASDIEVRYQNFGLCWFEKDYLIEPACSICWARGGRRSPSALELSCRGRKARFAFDITREEADSLLHIIHQRFAHITQG